jgi:hypothetical protein
VSESENVDVQIDRLGERIEIVQITVDVIGEKIAMIDRKITDLQTYIDNKEDDTDE